MGWWQQCFSISEWIAVREVSLSWVNSDQAWSWQRSMCLPPTTHKTQTCLQRKQDMRISHQDVCHTICFHPLRGCLLSILACYSYLFFKTWNIEFAVLQFSGLCSMNEIELNWNWSAREPKETHYCFNTYNVLILCSNFEPLPRYSINICGQTCRPHCLLFCLNAVIMLQKPCYLSVDSQWDP